MVRRRDRRFRRCQVRSLAEVIFFAISYLQFFQGGRVNTWCHLTSGNIKLIFEFIKIVILLILIWHAVLRPKINSAHILVEFEEVYKNHTNKYKALRSSYDRRRFSYSCVLLQHGSKHISLVIVKVTYILNRWYIVLLHIFRRCTLICLLINRN